MGLRQSDALFSHIKNLPELCEETFVELLGRNVDIVCASEYPRREENSYMPVFAASKSFGKSLAAALNCIYYPISHQEGHIAAGILSAKRFDLLDEEFLALHISGGTTELLHVKPAFDDEHAFDTHIVGGTKDLNAGQYVDRVGVSLGFSFPAGGELDTCSCTITEDAMKIPIHTEGSYLSFSGPESCVMRIIEEGKHSKQEIARATFNSIAQSLVNISRNALENTNVQRLLVVGGVSGNTIIRKRLMDMTHENGMRYDVIFATKELSGDNAVGASYIGQIMKSRRGV